MLPRAAAPALEQAMRAAPVVVLLGARQTGKTVIESGRRLLPVEVKAAARVLPADARGLDAFLDEYHDLADGALLLYDGTDTFPLTRRVLAVPWWRAC